MSTLQNIDKIDLYKENNDLQQALIFMKSALEDKNSKPKNTLKISKRRTRNLEIQARYLREEPLNPKHQVHSDRIEILGAKFPKEAQRKTNDRKLGKDVSKFVNKTKRNGGIPDELPSREQFGVRKSQNQKPARTNIHKRIGVKREANPRVSR